MRDDEMLRRVMRQLAQRESEINQLRAELEALSWDNCCLVTDIDWLTAQLEQMDEQSG